MSSLKDKVIVITGSGDETGLGATAALYMIQYGPSLVLTGRDKQRLDVVGDRCKEAGLPGDKMLLVVCDVNKDTEQERLVAETIKFFGKIDVLVNNAGALGFSSTLTTPMSEFDRIMKTNIRAPFYLTQLCLPHLIKTKGNIVNISSLSGQNPYTGHVPYAISKAALDHFTKIVANEHAHDGVRVNSICPTVVKTQIFHKAGLSNTEIEEFSEKIRQAIPLGRVVDALEVAKAIVFLASDHSSFTTGQILFVDGGLNIKT